MIFKSRNEKILINKLYIQNLRIMCFNLIFYMFMFYEFDIFFKISKMAWFSAISRKSLTKSRNRNIFVISKLCKISDKFSFRRYIISLGMIRYSKIINGWPPRTTSTFNWVKLCTSHDKCMLCQIQEVGNFFGFLFTVLFTCHYKFDSPIWYDGKLFYAKNIVFNSYL